MLTTHYLEEAETLCERIGMLKQGRLVALDSTHNLLKRFAGIRLRLRLSGGALPESLVHLSTSMSADAEWILGLRDYAQVAPA